MAVEDEHLDVLQNLEASIIAVYDEHDDLIDAEVMTALDALIRRYGAEAQGKTLASRPIRGIAKEVMEAVQTTCEWRLGRAEMDDLPGDPAMDDDPDFIQTVDVIVASLKRIQSSVKFWTQKNGRQGYLDYVRQFMG